jgi:hypothetical protein
MKENFSALLTKRVPTTRQFKRRWEREMDIKKQVQEHFAKDGGPTSGYENANATPAEAIEPKGAEVITQGDRTQTAQVVMTVYESPKHEAAGATSSTVLVGEGRPLVPEDHPILPSAILRITDNPRPTNTTQCDFVQTYVRYADVIEAPPEAHEAVATELLATVLNPRVHIQNGALKIPLDLWLLLLSGSGLGRNTLVELARPIIDAAGLSSVILNTTWGSAQAFYQSMSEHPTGLLVWPELSVVLKKLADSRFGGAKEWLTDRYDNWNAPEEVRYRVTGKSSDTPSIVFPQAPRLNILATSSLDWFFANIAQEDATGGFVPRWVFKNIQGAERLVPIPQMPDSRLVQPLAEHLRRASTLEGVADLSEVEPIYADWYVETHHRFSSQPNRTLAKAFFNRMRTYVLKLALVYQVSASLNLRVLPAAMTRAMATAADSEKAIFALLPTGMNREGAEVDRIADVVRRAGADGLLRSMLTRAFQHVKSSDREGRISTLVQAGVLFRFTRETSGRRAEVLVHADYLEEYRDKFPEDKQL